MEEQIEVAILAGANDEDIDEIILHNIVGVENIPPPDEPALFDFENMTDEQCIKNFRFSRNDLQRLRNLLRIPAQIVTETRNKVDGMT